jgi:GDP-L-fucose synthase
MQPGARIYVAGHTGLAGSAIVRSLARAGHASPIVRRHAELDLTDGPAVRAFFREAKPEYVFIAAARVGGILANDTYPADFIHQNLAIELNIIHEAWTTGVKRLIFLGSSCIYPRDCPQPIREEYFMTGPLEHTNRAYAVGKIAGVEMCWSYNRQHGTKYLAPMATNLYGPGDNYDPQGAHVLPALIRRFHEARLRGDREVAVWGSGRPRREFLYSDDLGDACVHLMRLPETEFGKLVARDAVPIINAGVGKDLSIAELAAVVADAVGFGGKLVFDSSKPDGTTRKVLDVSRIAALGWKPAVGLRGGIALAYKDFQRRFAAAA